MSLSDLEHGPEFSKVKRERDAWKQAYEAANAELAVVRTRLDIIEGLDNAPVVAPKWAKPKAKAKRQATALLMLSDLHLDEVVRPEEILHLNAYNRRIAEQRLKRTVEQSLVVSRDLLNFNYDGAVLLLGGDLFSGNIHEELRETNEAPILASLEYWLDPMASAVETLAEEFGKLLVVGVVGNHGRLSRKWRFKGTVQDNYDWLLMMALARQFRQDKRITWNIPTSVDAYFDLYGHRHLLTHGNQAKGGSGIAGIMTPIALFDHRKRKRDATTIGSAGHTWIGHWHQYTPMGSITISGSLKGYDDYAFGNNFGYEPAQQPFAVITPEHNVTIQLPIYSEDRKAEGW